MLTTLLWRAVGSSPLYCLFGELCGNTQDVVSDVGVSVELVSAALISVCLVLCAKDPLLSSVSPGVRAAAPELLPFARFQLLLALFSSSCTMVVVITVVNDGGVLAY